MITLSIIKADTGGFVGHSSVHPDMLAAAQEALTTAILDHLVIDAKVASCGDDISLIMTHEHGADAEPIHSFAWDTFLDTTEIAKRLGLYGAGQDLLSDAFSGTCAGWGPAAPSWSSPNGPASRSSASSRTRRSPELTSLPSLPPSRIVCSEERLQ